MSMESIRIENMYDLNETIAVEIFEGKAYPWEVLPLIKEFIVKLGNTLDPAEYDKLRRITNHSTLTDDRTATDKRTLTHLGILSDDTRTI